MRRWSRQFVIGLSLVLMMPGVALAEWQSSSNWGMNESEIGGNGQFDSFSTNYSTVPGVDDSGLSLGESAVGNSSSTNYQTNSGFNTTAQPGLTLLVNTSTVPLGLLSTSTASTQTATFSVKNYTSYGYVVSLVGNPPTNSGHPLTALTTDTASAATTEQFGINLRSNASPVAVGADPVQVPSSTFSYGVAGDGSTGTYGTTRPYTVPDKYRYISGETIASAPRSSGETDYTVTFLANISALTPGGAYQSNMDILVTGTY